MDIAVLHPDQLTADQVGAWAALQEADPRLDSPFLSPAWTRAVARAQARHGQREIKVAMVKQDGRDVGFLPARVAGGAAMPVGAPMCDYQALVCEPGLNVDPAALVTALGAGRMDFDHLLTDQAAFAPFVKGRDVSWVADIGASYAAYEAERREAGCGALKDLDKKRRKIEREHGAVTFAAFSRSRSDFDALIGWKRGQHQRTGQTDILAAGWTKRLVEDLFESRDADFGGVLFTLHLGDKLIAAHFHLHGARTVHGWLIGHDEAFERYSPGLLLFQDILRWMETTPYRRLDFGAGEYRFKRELSNTQVEIAHGFVGRPSAASLMRGAFYGVRAAAESLPLGKFSSMPGKAMRRLDIQRALRA